MTVALSLLTAFAWTAFNFWIVPLSRSVDPYVASLRDAGRQRPLHDPARARARRLPRPRDLGPLGYAAARGRARGRRLRSSSARSDAAISPSWRPIIGLAGGIAALAVFAFGEQSAADRLGLAISLAGGCLAAAQGGRRTAAGALPAAGAAVCFGFMFALYAAAEDLGPVSAVAAGRLSALALLGVIVALARRADAGPRPAARLLALGALDRPPSSPTRTPPRAAP